MSGTRNSKCSKTQPSPLWAQQRAKSERVLFSLLYNNPLFLAVCSRIRTGETTYPRGCVYVAVYVGRMWELVRLCVCVLCRPASIETADVAPKRGSGGGGGGLVFGFSADAALPWERWCWERQPQDLVCPWVPVSSCVRRKSPTGWDYQGVEPIAAARFDLWRHDAVCIM